MESIANKLNIARKELLDLSFRNPLLNFKLRKKTGLEFFELNPNDVYDYFVNEEKTLQFSRELSKNPGRLWVDLEDKELKSRLLRTYRESMMFLEEKGANTLFLALGFLKWKSENTDLKSPLVLIPVELKKADNLDRFSLVYSKEDIKFNISLETKLKLDFDIDISTYDDENFDLLSYFRYISESVFHNEGFEVLTEGALDFFSYGKYLMYQDLDVSKWVKDGKFINDKIMQGLFVEGFHDQLTDSNHVDINEITKPTQFFPVVDADSSQALAIHDVNKGNNLVLQGPPGTGKSQTITNIIANAVAMGKTVLFVSEKASALEVVQRRLKSVGLSDIALELHSNKVNKKELLKALEETLLLGEPKISDSTPLYEKYMDVKGSIDAYKDAVNKPILNSKLSPMNIYGDLLRLKDNLDKENIRLPRIEFPNIAYWTDSEFQKKYDTTKEFINVAKNIGKVEKHNFYGVLLTQCLPYEQVSIKEKVIALDDALSNLTKSISDLTKLMGIHSIDNMFDSNHLSYCLHAFEDLMDVKGMNVKDYRFYEQPNYILGIIQKGKEAKEDLLLLKGCKKEALNEFDLMNMIEEWNSLGFSHQKQKKHIKEELKRRTSLQEKKELDALYHYQQIASYFKREQKNIYEIFQTAFLGIEDTNWDEILVISRFAIDMHKRIASYEIIPQLKNIIGEKDIMERAIALNFEYQEAMDVFLDALDKVMKSMHMDIGKRFGYPKWYLDTTFSEIRRLIASFMDTDKIIEIVRYNEVYNKMIDLGLETLVSQAGLWRYDLSFLADLLEYERLKALVDTCFQENPVLQSFKRFNHERQIEMFKELDINLMVENIKYILHRHWENAPKMNDNEPEMNILRREFQKKKNQMPIRKLMVQVGHEIQRIKPIFMMSPLSIATYLEPGKMNFDLVVFDEASQVRPVEAFGALLRANQIVVVGDSHQLPPTNFFDTLTTKYEGMTDEDYDFSNMESILSLLLAKNIPERTLNWHYRSRHKSLIMISNKEFYNNSLCLFPSVDDLDLQEGLIYNYLPNTVYQRGKTRSNPLESKAVIKQVMKHALEHPNESLGVVSFSMAQADELYEEFARQMKKNTSPEVEHFFHSHETEPFFIKNLENVQGDERDVIFISIGYGRDENGNLSMDFGPLNKEGGERRLNVLITRARSRTEIFSNITGYDINLAKTQSQGVKALKKYLDYAQNRKNYDERNKESETEAFTDYLYNRLIEYGFTIERNVGVPGYGIDLAIVDPNNPTRFLLGLELDGGCYSHFDSATDRERLRNAVLTNLGWKMYHLWTTDFYRNPKMEFEKLLNYINNVRDMKVEEVQTSSIDVKRAHSVLLKKEDWAIDYKIYNGPKRRASIIQEIDTLKDLIMKIVQTESPIHEKEIVRRIQNVVQMPKVTDKLKQNVHIAIENCLDLVTFENNFVSIPSEEIRVRRRLNQETKKMEYVPFLEVKEAVYHVIDTGEATTMDDIKNELSSIFGFTKTNPVLLKDIEQSITEMVNEKTIYIEEEIYYINDFKDVKKC